MAGFLSALGSIATWIAANPAAIAAVGKFILTAIQTLTGHAPATAVAEEGKKLVAAFPGAAAPADGNQS